MKRRDFLKIFGTTATAGLICPNELLAMSREEKKIISSFLGHKIDVEPTKSKKIIVELPKGFKPVPVTSAKETLAMIDKANFHIFQTNNFQKNIDISKQASKYYSNLNERKLNLYNSHTGERFNDVFWVNGKYDLDALNRIDRLMRDHRQNQVIEMKLGALEGLYRMQHYSDKRRPIIITSAYRSQKTNSMLRRKSKNVAKYSLHIKGAAIDFTVDKYARVQLNSLIKVARKYHNGGVGYYPRSNFIHIDAGNKRYWKS
jgi:uncharacterized protein YcbK (DUF882 family)